MKRFSSTNTSAGVPHSASTMADRQFQKLNPIKNTAFTMAEILLSLTIIGVVAAITLPSLTGNINERTWATQKKALYARMSQAIPLIGSVNGYADSETFITAALSKVLKINNICDKDHLEDCGIATKFTTLTGNTFSYSTPLKMSDYNEKMTNMLASDATTTYSYSQDDSEAAAFETANGESVILFYFPKCQPDMSESVNYFVQPKICVNMIYDLNGNKGPNTVGKDVGIMTVLYATDSVVAAPQPWYRNSATSSYTTDHTEAQQYCRELDPEYRMPNLDELGSMFANMTLLDFGDVSSTHAVWSSEINAANSSQAWDQSFMTGYRRIRPRTENLAARCVKR